MYEMSIVIFIINTGAKFNVCPHSAICEMSIVSFLINIKDKPNVCLYFVIYEVRYSRFSS